jgi:hypothetical protein
MTSGRWFGQPVVLTVGATPARLARKSVSLAGFAATMSGQGGLSHIRADPQRDLFRAPMTIGDRQVRGGIQ